MVRGQLWRAFTSIAIAIKLAEAYIKYQSCNFGVECCAYLSSSRDVHRKSVKGEVVEMLFYYQKTDGYEGPVYPKEHKLLSIADDGTETSEYIIEYVTRPGGLWPANKVAWLKVCAIWNGYNNGVRVTNILQDGKSYWISIGEPVKPPEGE